MEKVHWETSQRTQWRIKLTTRLVPCLFEGLEGDSECAYVHVCESCANEHVLDTSDSCCNGNVCLVLGCKNETSLVHYVWDYRPEVIEFRRKARDNSPTQV